MLVYNFVPIGRPLPVKWRPCLLKPKFSKKFSSKISQKLLFTDVWIFNTIFVLHAICWDPFLYQSDLYFLKMSTLLILYIHVISGVSLVSIDSKIYCFLSKIYYFMIYIILRKLMQFSVKWKWLFKFIT